MSIKFVVKRETRKQGEKQGKFRVNAKGQSLIYCRYTDHDNSAAKKYSKVFFSTKLTIEPKYWDDIVGQAKGGSPKAKSINSNLNEFEASILDRIKAIKDRGQYPTPSRLSDEYKSYLESQRTELALSDTIKNQWRAYIDYKSVEISKRTIINYTQSLNVMSLYLDEELKQSNLKPSYITLAFLDRFKVYLSVKYKPNTVAVHFKRLKEFLKYYKNRGGELNAKLNLDDIKYKESPKPKVYLTELELEKIESKDFKGGRAINKDMFLLQCNTGLRISDLKNLDENIEEGFIKLTTQKNDREVEIPINPKARQILEKYDYSLPTISEPVFNRDIKTICKTVIPESTVQVRDESNKLIPVPKHELISSHDAIRTFILLCINKGMTLYSIAQITGKSMKVLERHYIPESTSIANNEFIKAWDIAPMKVAN